MKESNYKTYDELPLFLNAETVANVLGIAMSSAYELMKEKEEKEAALEEKMDRWVYLNDLAEQIEAQKNK